MCMPGGEVISLLSGNKPQGLTQNSHRQKSVCRIIRSFFVFLKRHLSTRHPVKPWSQHEESCRTPSPSLWQGHSRADITHNTLLSLFPWCNKNVLFFLTECRSSELLALWAGEMWHVCLQICHPPGAELPGLQSGLWEEKRGAEQLPSY